MITLGIETSCDETSVAIVKNGSEVLSNIVHTQIDTHKIYGGVVPEVAARSHMEIMIPAVEQALNTAKLSWQNIDAIGVTYAPGLIGSLLIGTLTARTLAITKNIPLYPIHHIKSHIYANFLGSPQPQFPMLALVVSGAHTQLVLFNDHDSYKLLGQTQDDAVGEAFDKVAKITGLPYPGGPSISHAAHNGDANIYKLPKAKLSGQFDYSFSGLKTAVLRLAQKIAEVDHTFPSTQLPARLTDQQRADIAASFQHTAVETLVDKTIKAYNAYMPKTVVIAGGVAANQELRKQLTSRLPISISYPDMSLCTDNAAMIAARTYYEAQTHKPCNPYSLEVVPSLQI